MQNYVGSEAKCCFVVSASSSHSRPLLIDTLEKNSAAKEVISSFLLRPPSLKIRLPKLAKRKRTASIAGPGDPAKREKSTLPNRFFYRESASGRGGVVKGCHHQKSSRRDSVASPHALD